MVSGFNSDVEHNGLMYHVQTEERGTSNPVIVTLVYCGGQIVTSLEVSYAELVSSPCDMLESQLRDLMQSQHRDLIRQIRNGKYDPNPMPFGHNLLSNHSLDELVLDYLEQNIADANELGESSPDLAVDRPEEDLALAAARVVKVDRVLSRLERFLTAAERAKDECAAAAAHAEVEPEPPTAEPVPESDTVVRAEPAVVATAPPALEQPDRSTARRTPRWIWLAAAAAMAIAAIALFLLSRPSEIRGTEAPPPEAAPLDSAVPTEETSPRAGEPEPADGSQPAEPQVAEPQVAEPQVADPQVADPAGRPAAAEAGRIPSAPRSASTSPVTRRPPPPTVPPPDRAPEAASTRPELEAGLVAPAATPAERQPTPQAEPRPFEPSEVDVTPRPRKRELPRYTKRARRLRQQGSVQLRFLVDELGEVAEVRVIEGIPDSDLDDAAADAARGWEFSPARKAGKPVKVWQRVAFDFSVLPNRTTSVKIRE